MYIDLACTVVCLLAQQLQLPESTCVGRDLGTFSRTGQWALIIQPSGPQIIPDVTCAVKAVTQIRVMNSAHFILSYRVLNSLCSFIYNKQTHVYVYTHTLLPLYAVPTSPSTHTPKSFTELFPMEVHCSPFYILHLCEIIISPLISSWSFWLALLASVTFTMFQEDDFPLHYECHDYVWGGRNLAVQEWEAIIHHAPCSL